MTAISKKVRSSLNKNKYRFSMQNILVSSVFAVLGISAGAGSWRIQLLAV